jgi:hypothetical protein
MSVVSRSQTTAVGFDPVSLGGCSLWLDAADSNTLTLSGSNVIAWADKSGSNNNPTFGVNKPTYSATTRFVETSGLNQAFTVPGGIFNTVAGSIFMVFADKQDNSTNGVFFGGLADYATSNFYAQSGLRNDGFSYALTGVATPPAGFLSQINTRSMILYNQNYIYNSSNITAGINGTMYSMTSTFGNRVVTPSGGLGISGTTWGGQTNLRIYEILFYNSVLTTAQRQQIEGYLAWKWDLVVSPPDIGGLSLWLDAADSTTLTLSGSTVTQWRDKSGNGRHAAQVGTGPTRGSNAVVFSGSQVMSGSANYLHNSTNGTWSILSVFRPASLSVGNPRILNYQGTPNRVAQMLYIESGTLTTLSWLSGEASLVQAFGGSIVSNTTYIAGAVNTTSNLTAYRNGVAGTAVSHGAVTTISNGTYVLGGMAQGEDMFNGSMYEVLVYSNALTTTQRQQLESYLSRKWNVAVTPTAVRYPKLAATHPYQLTLPVYRDFSPLDFDGLSLWLDAADQNSLTLSGSNVTTWADKSGTGGTGTASGTVTYVSNAVNGRPALSFTGVSNSYIRGSVSNTGTTFTCFAVATLNTGGNDQRILSLGAVGSVDYNSASYAAAIVRFGTSNAFYTYRNNSGTSTLNVTYGTPFLVGSLYDGTNKALFVNGSGTSNASTGSFAISNYQIGASFTEEATLNYNGYISEVLVFNSALTTTQRQEVEAYLARKWGLQSTVLARTTHPYRYGPALVLPTQISGCALWLDAADSSTLTLSGSNVTAWADKSGNAYSAATYSGTITRTTQNGQGALNFGTGVMKIGSYGWPSYSSMFVVASTATGNFFIVQSRNDNEYLSFLYTGNWNLAQVFDGTSKLALNDSVIAQGTPIVGSNQLFMLGFGYNGGTSSSFYTLNGSNRATTLVSGSGLSNVTTTGQPLYINGRWNTSLDNSVVCEILQFSRSLSSTERQQIEGYLAWKWGLQSNLPTSNHPFLFYKALTPTFTPLQISGLSLWLDAADATTLTLSGSNVTAWADKSGNGRTATQSTASNQAVYSSTSNAVVFNGSNWYPTSYSASLSNETTFIVFQYTGSLTQERYLLGGGPSGGTGARCIGFYQNSVTGSIGYSSTATAWGSISASNAINTASRYLFTGIVSNSSSSLALNGGTYTTPASLTLNANQTTMLGVLYYNSALDVPPKSFIGNVYEVICYSNVLTTAQRQQVEGYLAAKWGLQPSLPPSTNHPYRFGPWVGTPTQISGCALWLDAADATTLTLSGSNVTQWRDKSGNGNNATAAGNAAVLSSNSILFTGTHGVSSTRFTIADAASLRLTTPFTIYMVYAATPLTPTSNNDYGSMILLSKFVDGGSYPGWAYRARGKNTSNVIFTAEFFNSAGSNQQGDVIVTSSNVVDGTRKIIGLNQRTSNTMFTFVNGSADLTISPMALPISSTDTVMIGARNTTQPSNNPFNGSVNEIIVHTGSLSREQCQQIEGYLAWKWGLQGNLTSGGTAHPYKSFRP